MAILHLKSNCFEDPSKNGKNTKKKSPFPITSSLTQKKICSKNGEFSSIGLDL
ncbi:hypothetical protein SOVF_076140 [Spinacia oleracea]|nr:hypothetical protein SOVF_076140 [Spinacia oleracea]